MEDREYSKTNPGCYHSALRYLSEVTGIAIDKAIEVKNIDALYYTTKSRPPKKKLNYKSYNIYGVDSAGNRFAFFENHKRFDERGLVAVKFVVKVNRSLEEFNVQIKGEGKYNDSLGGGWSQNVPLYSINGNYFADMDCAH